MEQIDKDDMRDLIMLLAEIRDAIFTVADTIKEDTGE